MRPDIVSGAVLPDYELSDDEATSRKLCDLQGDGPWCPQRAATERAHAPG